MTDLELKEYLEEIKGICQKAADAAVECLTRFDQLYKQYELLRKEHLSNHRKSDAPVQLRRKR